MTKYGWVAPAFNKGREAKNNADKILNPVPPQPGLKPVGGDFYATPPTPQEPNYDDIFSDTPIGFDFDIVKDGCNFGVQITGSIAFIKLPSFQFVWRDPKCNPREEPFELPEAVAVPSESNKYWKLKYTPYLATCREVNPSRYPELIIDGYGYNFRNNNLQNSEAKFLLVVDILIVEGEVRQQFVGGIGTIFYWRGSITYRAKKQDYLANFQYEGIEYNIFGNALWSKRTEVIVRDETVEGVYKAIRTDSGWDVSNLGGDDDDYLRGIPGIQNWDFYEINPVGEIDPDELEQAIVSLNNEKRKFREILFYDIFSNPTWTPQKGLQGLKYKYIDGDENINYANPFIYKTIRAGGETYIYLSDGVLNKSNIPQINFEIDFDCDVPKPPAPLPPMKKDCCEEILARLALLIKRVGDLPAFVPDNFTNSPPQRSRKNSLAELIIWNAKQLESISGKYPLEIKIQDSDPETKGNQEKVISLPNQAELLADIYQAVLLSKQINEALLPIALKTLVETGSIKLTALATHDLAFGNADFLGWDIAHTKDKVKFSFNPTGNPNDPMSKLLEPTEVEVKGYENKDKKDFRTWVVPLLRMASAWMAQNFRKVPDADSLKATLGKTPDGIIEDAEINKPEEEDFDVFVNNVELGFISEAGITDTLNPYGQPFDERPKIREFGGGDAVTD
ncbi:hypothetical protein [Anabaena azotica]|uniref:hypothetical protein n=1 Tax=Anabaena azotica TaxID=197653 RepID=UPI0039A4B2AA